MSGSGSQIFLYSKLRQKIKDNTIGFPQPESLVDNGHPVEYFIMGDDALLQTWLMKPYSCRSMDLNERVFDYRLRCGRRVVENVLSILDSRFRVLQSTMQ